MPEILLVGDTAAYVALESALADSSQRWSVRKMSEAQAALAQLERRAADVLLVAAGNDPGQWQPLLASATSVSPRTLRFVLFAHGSATPLKVLHAHQVLAERSDMSYLLPILESAAEVAMRADDHPQLRRIIAQLHDVPSPPTLYFDIREQVENMSGDLSGMAEATARDPSLVARILKIANSGFYGLPRSISDISEAVGLIGTDALLGLVLAAHLYAGLPPPGLKLELLWQHTFRVSTLAKQIVQMEGGNRMEQSVSTVAGLLHDIGIMVLLENEPARYQPIWRQSGGDERILAELERETFGATHGELGALILMLWSVPDAVVKAVAHSHSAHLPSDVALPLVSRAVLAAEWLLDNVADDQAPEGLVDVPVDTLTQWQIMRDEVSLQSLAF